MIVYILVLISVIVLGAVIACIIDEFKDGE